MPATGSRTGAYGSLPVMKEVKREAARRKVEIARGPNAPSH